MREKLLFYGASAQNSISLLNSLGGLSRNRAVRVRFYSKIGLKAEDRRRVERLGTGAASPSVLTNYISSVGLI